MFVYIGTKDFQGHINLDKVTKIIPRLKDGDANSTTWEVVLFYEHIRRFNPTTGKVEWIGSYDVLLEGTTIECQDFVEKLNLNR